MRIALVTCMHRRAGVTAIFAEQLKRLRDEQNFPELACYASVTAGDEANLEICKGAGIAVKEVPNKPLGAKWNSALSLARQGGHEGYMILGSDDIISAEWLATMGDEVKQGSHNVWPDAIYHYDVGSGRAKVIGPPLRGGRSYFGAGRVVSEKALSIVKEPLWQPSMMNGLDGWFAGVLAGYGMPPRIVGLSRPQIVDLKVGRSNIWSFGHWHGRRVNGPAALWMMGTKERELLQQLRG